LRRCAWLRRSAPEDTPTGHARTRRYVCGPTPRARRRASEALRGWIPCDLTHAPRLADGSACIVAFDGELALRGREQHDDAIARALDRRARQPERRGQLAGRESVEEAAQDDPLDVGEATQKPIDGDAAAAKVAVAEQRRDLRAEVGPAGGDRAHGAADRRIIV